MVVQEAEDKGQAEHKKVLDQINEVKDQHNDFTGKKEALTVRDFRPSVRLVGWLIWGLQANSKGCCLNVLRSRRTSSIGQGSLGGRKRSFEMRGAHLMLRRTSIRCICLSTYVEFVILRQNWNEKAYEYC